MDRGRADSHIVNQPDVYMFQPANNSFKEEQLKQFLFAKPQLLPIAEIDPSFAPLIPLCCEMPTGRGFIDTVFISRDGLLTIVEYKLWRNQEAKRNVVAQILAYAAAIKWWDYRQLQNALTHATQRTGDRLYTIVASRHSELAESTFVDNVSRNLRQGRFLLLIIGDRIREDVEQIVGLLHKHAQSSFKLELIRIHNAQFVVHKPVSPTPAVGPGFQRSEYTREDVVDLIRTQNGILAQRLDEFLDIAEEKCKLFVDTGTGSRTLSIILRSGLDKDTLNFGVFRSDLTFRNYGIAKNPHNPKDRTPYPLGETYLRTLASLLPNTTVYKSVDPFEWTVKKTDGSYVPVAEVLDKQEEILNLICDTRDKIVAALQASPS